MKIKLLFLFLAILLVGFLVRAWRLGSVPPGLNVDEVSEGYNAYSLLKTGKDRYGMVMPITFKSYGSYQLPLYTYLTVLSEYVLGPTIIGVKLVTLASGLLVIIITFLIISEFFENKKHNSAALYATLIISIAPWAIFFSRMATEASLSLAIFVVGFYLMLKTLKKPKLFPLACIFIGAATYAYYSERVISLLFLVGFVFFNRKLFLKRWKLLILGLIVFGAIQIPNLAIVKSGAFTRRLEQVTYLNSQAFERNGIAFRNIPFGRELYIIREFSSQYQAYFSPRNLFFQPDDQGGRSLPDLSVFYGWMVVPWLFGLGYFIRNRKDFLISNLLLLMVIAPIPAALSTDPFYTLRILVLLWVFAIVIGVGSLQLLEKIRLKQLKYFIFFAVLGFSLFSFYMHYFILFGHERGETVGYSGTELVRITTEEPDKKFVVDLSRDVATGIRFAFFRKYDPQLFQRNIGAPFLTQYYNSTDYEKGYNIYNVEIRPINWVKDVYKDQILVGDLLAISDQQVAEHKLKPVFEIKDLTGQVALKGYTTQPKEKCRSLKVMDSHCKNI